MKRSVLDPSLTLSPWIVACNVRVSVVRMKSYFTVWESESFTSYLWKRMRVCVTAWWMIFFCTRCLWNKMISCGSEAALFSLVWSSTAISTVTHYIHCMIGLQCVLSGCVACGKEGLQYARVCRCESQTSRDIILKPHLWLLETTLANICSDKWNTHLAFASKQFTAV